MALATPVLAQRAITEANEGNGGVRLNLTQPSNSLQACRIQDTNAYADACAGLGSGGASAQGAQDFASAFAAALSQLWSVSAVHTDDDRTLGSTDALINLRSSDSVGDGVLGFNKAFRQTFVLALSGTWSPPTDVDNRWVSYYLFQDVMVDPLSPFGNPAAPALPPQTFGRDVYSQLTLSPWDAVTGTINIDPLTGEKSLDIAQTRGLRINSASVYFFDITNVPEPGSLALGALALLALGLNRRGRRAQSNRGD